MVLRHRRGRVGPERRQVAVLQLIAGYRNRGHQKARLDPLGLMERQCGECGLSKAKALLPLMRPDFRLFSELVLDTATAKELLCFPSNSIAIQ